MSEQKTIEVTITADVSGFVKAMEKFAKAVNDLYEAYLASLPWYERWWLRGRLWWGVQRTLYKERRRRR